MISIVLTKPLKGYFVMSTGESSRWELTFPIPSTYLSSHDHSRLPHPLLLFYPFLSYIPFYSLFLAFPKYIPTYPPSLNYSKWFSFVCIPHLNQFIIFYIFKINLGIDSHCPTMFLAHLLFHDRLCLLYSLFSFYPFLLLLFHISFHSLLFNFPSIFLLLQSTPFNYFLQRFYHSDTALFVFFIVCNFVIFHIFLKNCIFRTLYVYRLTIHHVFLFFLTFFFLYLFHVPFHSLLSSIFNVFSHLFNFLLSTLSFKGLNLSDSFLFTFLVLSIVVMLYNF